MEMHSVKDAENETKAEEMFPPHNNRPTGTREALWAPPAGSAGQKAVLVGL